MQNDIYTGVEAEGRLAGVHTVFAMIPCLEACELARKEGITHVFFGVRGKILNKENFEELDRLQFAAIPPTWIVTIQMPLDRAHEIPAWVFDRCHVLLYESCSVAHLLSGDVEIKLENRLRACVYNKPQNIDLHYVYDKEIK